MKEEFGYMVNDMYERMLNKLKKPSIEEIHEYIGDNTIFYLIPLKIL